MHDPMTVAFEIKSPLRDRPTEHFPEGYRQSLVTIWHRDPERDGSDDSCGWCYPKLTEAQHKSLKGLAWSEAGHPWFQRLRVKRHNHPVEAESLMRAAIVLVARAIDIPMTWESACLLATQLIHSPMDNFRGSLCHLPGYHTNFEEDLRREREDHALRLFSGVAKRILRDRRSWWRHPKWHIHHWRIQFRPYQAFLRWAFTRCAHCGGRFAWGETGVGTWSSEGPRWFRSETLTHTYCETSRQAAGIDQSQGASS